MSENSFINSAPTRIRYTGSFKVLKSMLSLTLAQTLDLEDVWLEISSSLSLMSKQLVVRIPINMNPRTRIVQGNPIFGYSELHTNGQITPPILAPGMAIPKARPRFCLKKWAIQLTIGAISSAQPIPQHTPNERTNCHTCVQLAVAKSPPQSSTAPGTATFLAP
ncbi:hypothetical protein OGAPHI_000991 [Ogataea philodendri]|uniref:Uncharacterized protein n=1 Tax=Ogataea philodendri TaxID=1378263 RepID=A0A9P8T9W4_9ASCO|nr:uncharacterized protein OGAPHI_000991 [Ogataea philodendri]KAH3670476.1 hypothetical protein OGAPHI_000991 [Ogataea philodendri]